MLDFTVDNLADAVLARLEGSKNERFTEVMTSLIRHMHEFVKEVHLTEEEWFAGIQFLTACGQISDEKRQEFILLSDTLGVSMLVDALNHGFGGSATESTILGPFYVDGAPALPLGANIASDKVGGEPVVVSGRVADREGRPIAGALLDVWHSSPDGMYDVQAANYEMDRRGRFRTDADGKYWFRSTKPVPYPIPTDGPVGRMLDLMGRHPMRPAHMHFIVSADGYERLTTHIFVPNDPYIESDAVFAVKSALIASYEQSESADEAARLGVKAPFWTTTYDFTLAPAERPVENPNIPTLQPTH